jgi:ESCRT-I complex subunit VPS28
MGEIKAFDNVAERKVNDELGTFYQIIRVTEALESAFSKDAVSEEDYTTECNKLISQFKSTEAALKRAGIIKSAKDFIDEYQFDCHRAVERLIDIGVPATVAHAQQTGSSGGGAKQAAAATEAFITLLDSLQVGQRGVEDVKPLVQTLCLALDRVDCLPPKFAPILEMRKWLAKLHQMRAVEQLSTDDCQQLIMDINSHYISYTNALK